MQGLVEVWILHMGPDPACRLVLCYISGLQDQKVKHLCLGLNSPSHNQPSQNLSTAVIPLSPIPLPLLPGWILPFVPVLLIVWGQWQIIYSLHVIPVCELHILYIQPHNSVTTCRMGGNWWSGNCIAVCGRGRQYLNEGLQGLQGKPVTLWKVLQDCSCPSTAGRTSAIKFPPKKQDMK